MRDSASSRITRSNSRPCPKGTRDETHFFDLHIAPPRRVEVALETFSTPRISDAFSFQDPPNPIQTLLTDVGHTSHGPSGCGAVLDSSQRPIHGSLQSFATYFVPRLVCTSRFLSFPLVSSRLISPRQPRRSSRSERSSQEENEVGRSFASCRCSVSVSARSRIQAKIRGFARCFSAVSCAEERTQTGACEGRLKVGLGNHTTTHASRRTANGWSVEAFQGR